MVSPGVTNEASPEEPAEVRQRIRQKIRQNAVRQRLGRASITFVARPRSSRGGRRGGIVAAKSARMSAGGRRRPRARRVGRGRSEGRRTWRVPQRGGRAAKPARDFPAAYVDRTHRLSPTSARARARVKGKQASASVFSAGKRVRYSWRVRYPQRMKKTYSQPVLRNYKQQLQTTYTYRCTHTCFPKKDPPVRRTRGPRTSGLFGGRSRAAQPFARRRRRQVGQPKRLIRDRASFAHRDVGHRALRAAHGVEPRV